MSVLAAPRAHQQGLLWLPYTNHWRGLNDEAKFEAGAPDAGPAPGPGRLPHPRAVRPAGTKLAAEFWNHLALSVQSRGEAHRLPQRARIRLPSMSWLDALSEFIWRGAIIVDGLVEPADPIPADQSAPVRCRRGRTRSPS